MRIADTSTRPNGDLVKEVHAYFGLCMYFAQVFETGLINALTALETAVDKKPFRATFDAYYAKHESLTFGNLLKMLSRHKFFSDDLLKEAETLKLDRDYLAHRFFRDHNLDELTIAGCYAMIDDLETRRKRFMDLDQKVTALEDRAFEKLGFDTETLRSETSRIQAEMIEEAKTRYVSKLPSAGKG